MPDGSKSTRPFNDVWWLRPRFAVIYLGLPVLVAAYLIPDSTYETLYRTEKHVDFNFLLIGILVYAGFLIGTIFTLSTRAGSKEWDVMRFCRWFVWPFFLLTLLGYVVWFGLAFIRMGGPVGFVSIFIEILQRPDAGFADDVKANYFETIGGITTFTQVGILYATVEALLWFRGNVDRRLALVRFSTIGAFTLLRMIMHSERLSLIEISVPVLVVAVASVRLTALRRTFIRFAPVFMGAAVFALFYIGEYFRSWSFYRNIYEGTYAEFVFQRFLGYYTTAANNGAIIYYFQPFEPLRYTLNPLFVFPGIGSALEDVYYANFVSQNIRYEYPYFYLLESYGNPEFNNIAPVGTFPVEYSLIFAPIAVFLLGFVAASLYKSFLSGKMIGMLLYPSWFIGLIEIPRVYYWADQRYFPVLAGLALSLILFKLMQVPTHVRPKGPRGFRARAPNENAANGKRRGDTPISEAPVPGGKG